MCRVVGWLLLVSVAVASEEQDNPRSKRLFGQEKTKVCFDDLGCFEKDRFRDARYRPNPLLPNAPDDVNAHFYLNTKNGKTNITNYKTMKTIPVKSGKPVTFIVHGFMASGAANWVTAIANRLLSTMDSNVITVDWKKGAEWKVATDLGYKQAVANTWIVGGQIWQICKLLNEKFGARYEDMHIIGHSLGSHVAGYAGARLEGKLGRISALDPAEPEFEDTAPHIRLDTTDAKFVDVIHTDASPYSTTYGYGMKNSVGHLDFYPNGGITQPGCRKKRSLSAQQRKRGAIGCHHSRATLLYHESLTTTCPFVGHECDSYEFFIKGFCNSCGTKGEKCARMGYHANEHPSPHGRGFRKLYLMTADKPPFCLYHYSVEVVLEKKPVKGGELAFTLYGTNNKTHNFKISTKGGSTIMQVTGCPNNLVSVKRLELKCTSGQLCKSGTLKIKNIVAEPLDVMQENQRKTVTTVLCQKSKVAIQQGKLNNFQQSDCQ